MSHLTIKNAEKLCVANRKAILLLFFVCCACIEDQRVMSETSN